MSKKPDVIIPPPLRLGGVRLSGTGLVVEGENSLAEGVMA
jgi:hypothetical protein